MVKRCVLIALFLTLGVSACSWTDALKVLTPSASKGINADAEVTVGQKKEDNDIVTQVGGNREVNQTAEVISNIDENVPPYILWTLILLAGWAIPDPKTMFQGIAKFITAILPWSK